jgi:antitoxin YefM
MPTATYSFVRENLAEIWNEVESSQTPIIITRRNHQDLALIPADELASLRETAHLMRSPKKCGSLALGARARIAGEHAAYDD